MIIELEKLKTAPLNEVATACGFRGPKQFRTVWEAAGYPIMRLSPKKHVVFVSDVAKFQSERILKSNGSPTSGRSQEESRRCQTSRIAQCKILCR
jgi:hypothetical protein